MRTEACTKPLVIGHRGNPGNPLNTIKIENTIPSFQSAWDVRADGVEFDVEMSTDGVLFVHHDDQFGRVFEAPDGNASRPVTEYTWDEIAGSSLVAEVNVPATDIGLSVPPIEVAVPRLESMLPPKDKLFFLELKIPDDKEPESPEGKAYARELAELAVEFIQKNKLHDNVKVLCFVASVLDVVKTLDSGIETAFNVFQNETRDPRFAQLLRELKKQYGFDAFNPPFEQVTDDSTNICHEAGVSTYPWVWKEPADKEISEATRLIRLGVDGIITNQPETVVGLVA